MRDWQHRIGKEKARELFASRWWEGKSPREIVDVQLFTGELCMPWELFEEAMAQALGRPLILRLEYGADIDRLRDEYLGKRPPPTEQEVEAMMKKCKVIPVLI